jgi:hypothetical protein
MEDRMSKFLLERIHEIDQGAEEEADPRFRRAVVRMTRYLLGSLEGFADTTSSKIRQLYESIALFEEILDDHYCREMLKRVPRMVDRTVRLAEIHAKRLPSEPAVLYLKDATRSYIFGLWTASVSLSRAAVERSLSDLVQERGVSPTWKFQMLVEKAAELNLLDAAHASMAKRVGNVAGGVLHGKRLKAHTADSTAWATLCAARGVLIHLYSDP